MSRSIHQQRPVSSSATPSLRNCITILSIVVTASAFVGCSSDRGILGVDCCADIPPGAIPEPAGAKVCQWETAQVTGAAADQLVLYRADFVGTTAELSPGALGRLARLAAADAFAVSPLIIEPSGNDELDAARTAAVVETLASSGIEDSRVEIAIPSALGMQGLQAERLGVGATGNRRSSGSRAPLSRPTARGTFGSGLGGGSF